MSVIIRLQNLPWSANAADIREFFKGLLIPEGGVHIVGGEQGDAFIAFGSDEDARLAMRKSNGILKGIQISLLLSSRSEMQKVIEMARQQALAQQQSFGTPAAPAAAPAPAQRPNSAAPQQAAAAPYSTIQQPQIPQYAGMNAYYSGPMYGKQSVDVPKPAEAATTLTTPFGYNSAPELVAQNWHNGFGKVDPSAIPGANSASYNRQMTASKPQFNNAYPFNPNDPKVAAYGMQPPTVPVTEEYDEKELYQQALRAAEKPEPSRLDEAPNSLANSVASVPAYSNTSVTSSADRAHYSSASVSQSSSKMAPITSNNQSPRRSEHSVERKETSKDKSRDKDKYGREERDRDSRRRRSKSRSRSRDRDRRRRHRSRSRSRDRTSRRRRSRSKERQERSRDRDKSRSSGASRDRNERRLSDDKPSSESTPAPPVVLSKNSGATLPGLGEIPQELPKSLPNAILGKPPSQEIITSDMYAPSVSGGAWGVDPKLKNAQSVAQQPPLVETTQSNVRDPRMQISSSSVPAVVHSEPRTDRWGIPIQEAPREPNQRNPNVENASPGGPPANQNRPNMDPNFGRDVNRFPRQPNNWDNLERPERDIHPDALPVHRNDLPPERPRGYIESARDPRSSQHVNRSPDVGPRGEPAMAERPTGPSRWSTPPLREPQNNYSRDSRAPRMGEPDYSDLPPPRRVEAPHRVGDGMEGHRQSLERYPDNRGMPGRPRDDRMWEPEMPERYPPRDEYPPVPEMEDPRMDSPGVHNVPFESAGRGMRGRGGFDPRGRGGRRRGFGRVEEEQFYPEELEPERFRGASFPNEYPPFDEGPRGSPSGPVPFRGRGGHRGRGGYARTASPIGDRPPTCSVELLNLPPSANYRVIRESFYGVYVPRDSIKLLGDENGVKIGVGLIRFNSEADALEASRRDGMFIHDCKIQIRLIDEEIYDKHEDFKALRPRPSFEAAPVNFIRSEWVHITGMPPGKTEDDVATIFSNSYINDILREVYPNTKKATGGFFMRLSCPDEAHVLISESQEFEVDGNLLHLRQATHAEIEECTVKLAERHLIEGADGHSDGRPPMPEEFDKRRDGMPRNHPGPGRPFNNVGPHQPKGNPGRKTALLATPPIEPDLRESLVHGNGEGKRPLDNPTEASSRKRSAVDEDLLTDSVVVHDVKMGTTHNNVVDFFSDEGLVPEHVHFVPYDPKVGGRVFVIFPRVSHARKALKKSGQMLGPSAVRIELIAKPEVMSAMGLPFNPLELIKKSDPTDDDRPEAGPRAARGPLLETPGTAPARGAAGGRGSPLLSSSSRGLESKQGEIIPEQFGQPGCVVALSNIPFNATTEDILMFLSREFPRVSPEHVIRRYNEHNQPTSDARVSFQTPEDAQKCVRTLNRKIIFNRVISITLVES